MGSGEWERRGEMYNADAMPTPDTHDWTSSRADDWTQGRAREVAMCAEGGAGETDEQRRIGRSQQARSSCRARETRPGEKESGGHDERNEFGGETGQGPADRTTAAAAAAAAAKRTEAKGEKEETRRAAEQRNGQRAGPGACRERRICTVVLRVADRRPGTLEIGYGPSAVAGQPLCRPDARRGASLGPKLAPAATVVSDGRPAIPSCTSRAQAA